MEEQYTGNRIGEYRDTIIYKDGTISVGEWHRNTIVTDINILIASLLKRQTGYTGIGYWVIGSGLSTWDNINPPAPAVSDHGVVTELGRKQILPANIVYIDDSDNIVTGPTNRIAIDVTFDYGECNGAWREFSIVGGNATATAGSGIAINHKTTGLILKTNKMQIRRQIKFSFR